MLFIFQINQNPNFFFQTTNITSLKNNKKQPKFNIIQQIMLFFQLWRLYAQIRKMQNSINLLNIEKTTILIKVQEFCDINGFIRPETQTNYFYQQNPMLYQKCRIEFLYNNINYMGKKLRSRTIYQTQEQQSLNCISTIIIGPVISKTQIRALASIKNKKARKLLNRKTFNFKKRFETPQFNTLIDQSKLQCSICLQMMVSPSMLLCGHIYCLRCLQSNSAHSQKCCLCRKQQQNNRFINNRMADKLINRLVLQETDLTIKYLCRTTDSAEWLKRRKLNLMKQGLVVDYQDRSNLWRRGIISEIKNQQKVSLNIKYFIRGQEIFQWLEADSRRLAPYTFFTRNKYLEQFSTCLPEFDLYEKELENLEYRREELDEQFFRFSHSENSSSQNEYLQAENVNAEGQNFLSQAFLLLGVDFNLPVDNQIYF